MTVVEGRMEFTVGGDRLELGPGDECFIPVRPHGACSLPPAALVAGSRLLCCSSELHIPCLSRSLSLHRQA